MKTKQLGIFACVAALVLMVSFSSSTVFTKGGGGGGPDRQVVILDCADDGLGHKIVGAVDSTDDDVLMAIVPGDSCAAAVASLLNDKYKIEAVESSEFAFMGDTFPSVSYTMVKK